MKPLRYRVYGFLLLACLSLFACQARFPVSTAPDQWHLADLRLLEAPNAANPDYDLIGAYLRQVGNDIELRFDLLGSPGSNAYDLYLEVDFGETQTTKIERPTEQQPIDWNLLFIFPGDGLPRVITADGQISSIRPRSIRGELSDSFRTLIAKSALPGDWKEASFHALITQPGSRMAEDQIGPFTFQTPAITTPAAMALVFWDTLPSATPAQALRRWNGAHTGPFGQRHGLKILLSAASQAQMPLALLDLQQPDRLAALEALGGLDLVHDLQRRNLLIIPDYGSSDLISAQKALQINTQAAGQYQLNRTVFYYGALPEDQAAKYRAVFGRQGDTSHIRTWKNKRIIPIPASLPGDVDAVTSLGLGIEARKALLDAALSNQVDDLVIFGGSLPSSPWADLLIAGPAFSDIAAHPWIQVLDQRGLQEFPARPGSADCADLLCLPEPKSDRVARRQEVENALMEAPDNLFSQLAWQTFLRLSEPTQDQRLAELRAGYLTQAGPILSAAYWLKQPVAETSCTADLDWDSTPECILASEALYFVIDPQGGRLIFGAAITKHGPVQLVGQRSQFIIGLGEPMDWKPEAGPAGDPEDIPGGFADLDDPWRMYQADLQPGLIRLTNVESGMIKTFQLKEDGLLVTIESQHEFRMRLPLALIDDRWLFPGAFFRYQSSLREDGLVFSFGKREIIHSSDNGGNTTLLSPFYTLALSQPEDPNTSYSANYFVPFPISILEIEGNEKLELLLSIQ